VTSVAIERALARHGTAESGKKVHGDLLLYAVGRETCADVPRPRALGLQTDERGRIAVTSTIRRRCPNVYAAGDVIGFPALAATAVEQGRLAACHMFGVERRPASNLPYGIYTIPEISMVGAQRGAAHRREGSLRGRDRALRRAGQGADDRRRDGMLKILFDPESLRRARCPRHRRPRRRDRPHRTGGDGARRHHRILP